MAEQTLKLDNIRLKKKEFHKSKEPIDLMSVNVDQIVVSEKIKHSEECCKYFIGYQENEIVKPLCIILAQMSGYIKLLNTLKTVRKTCLFFLKMTKCWISTIKFRMWLKITWKLNFTVWWKSLKN